MQMLDAGELADGTRLSCDVCVIGAGAAGVTVALQFLGSDLEVCVLDAGGTRPDDAATRPYSLEVTGLRVSDESRQRGLGGTTKSWWGKTALLGPGDLTTREWVPLSGWPIEHRELFDHYRAASRLLGWPDPDDYDRARLRRANGFFFDSDELTTAVFHHVRPPTDFGKLLRRRGRRAVNVRVVLHADVTGFERDEPGRRIARVDAAGPAGLTLAVEPRAVVLAAGGIENARILLAAEIGNDHDMVGRCFMDHPKGPAGTITVDPSALLPDASHWRERRARGARLRSGVALAGDAQHALGALNSYVLLEAVTTAHRSRGVVAARKLRSGKRKGTSILRLLLDVVLGAPSLASFVAFRARNRTGSVREIAVTNFLEQAPSPENRVTLSNALDSLGRPAARLEWSITEHDRASIRALHRALADAVAARGLGTFESPLLDEEPDEWPVAHDASHHIGTTRMGTDPASSVVDPDGRVHGTTNLYVAGSSVFPTSGYANPTLTIVALAIRLGRHLRAELERQGR